MTSEQNTALVRRLLARINNKEKWDAEEWGGLDQIDLLRQLGAVVSPGPHRTWE
jgi:hypothetical protein